MNLFKYLLCPALILSGILCSCDNLSLSERLDGPIETAMGKNVLIEDYTGQKCSNCPLAHEEAEKLQKTYGSRIIAVAVHGGPQAVDETDPHVIGLANGQSKEYNRRMGTFPYPKGCVDRQGGLLDFEKWNAAAVSRFALAPAMKIQVEQIHFRESSRTLSFECSLEGLENVEGLMQIWLTENDIVAAQAMPGAWGGGVKTDYVHRHVFRAALNGLDGEPFVVEKGKTFKTGYEYALPENWKAGNMSLVVICYNKAEGVLQVMDTPIAHKNGKKTKTDKTLQR